MEPLIVRIGLIVVAALVGSLITYYFSTKNMERDMHGIASNEAKSEVITHVNIKHQTDPWVIAEKKIKEHKDACGDELKGTMEKFEKKLDNVTTVQTQQVVEIRNMAKVIDSIAKKVFNGG